MELPHPFTSRSASVDDAPIVLDIERHLELELGMIIEHTYIRWSRRLDTAPDSST